MNGPLWEWPAGSCTMADGARWFLSAVEYDLAQAGLILVLKRLRAFWRELRLPLGTNYKNMI